MSASAGMFLPFEPQSTVVERNFSKVLWLELNSQSGCLTAKQIAERIGVHGDFTVVKGSRFSVFIEVIYLGMAVPDIDEFIVTANATLNDLGTFFKFDQAKRFKARRE